MANLRIIISFSILSVFISSCGSGKSTREITIAVIPMGTTHEFWKSIHAGAVTAAREIGGVKIIWKGPLREDDRDEQVRIIEDFTGLRVNAILLSPMDDRTFIRPVMEAKQAGIPTVLINSSLQGDVSVSYVATDNYKGGVLAAEHMGKITGGKGKLIIIRLNEADVTTMDRVRGFRETVASKYPGLEIISENQYAGVTTESAFRTGENLFNRFPEATALFTPNESSTFGFLRVLQDRGTAGKIFFIGFDSSEKLIESLRNREIRGLVIQNPFAMGYTGVKVAAAYLRGEKVEKRIDTGVILATPENMDDPEVKKLLKPDLSVLESK
jgi:ribose transport system substrate-binding protein